MVDLDTGEVIKQFKGKTYETIKQQREYLENYNITLTNNKYGDFVWVLYDVSYEYFSDIKPQNVARLLYIVTFLDYKGYLVYDNHAIMNKKGLYKKLNISRQEADRFYKIMIQNNILIENEGKIFINNHYFYRGRIQNHITQGRCITRLYIDGVRQLYEQSSASNHKQLGYIFKILPYVNQQYNIICKNPKTQEYKKINPVSLSDVCDIIHYNKGQQSRFIKLLQTFNIHNQPLINYAYKNTKIFINPRLFYSGDKWSEVEKLGRFC
jgi:hypothetical protein